MATYLERVFSVWQQLFYAYWSVPGRLTERIGGADRPLGPDYSFEVVLFRDRDEYVRQLSRGVPQIGISIGYYSQQQKTSFFYAAEPDDRPNWVHESAHQFFHETGTVAPQVGEQNNFWVFEGVALYMESLRDRGAYAATGGVDADRLQYARFRRLSEQYYVPLEQLVTYGRQQLQQDPDIRQLYSQAAGLTHFLLDGQRHERLPRFVEYLRSVYRGVAPVAALAATMELSFEQLDDQYVQFLNVTDNALRFVDPEIKNLCLTHTEVTDAGLAQVPQCEQLRWLDLSFTAASDAGVQCFAGSQQLDQLNLERTRITDRALETVEGFHKLQELDLSQTAVTDEGLKRLGQLRALQILWLTGTQVTDAGLVHLGSLRNLQQLESAGHTRDGRSAATVAQAAAQAELDVLATCLSDRWNVGQSPAGGRASAD